MFKEYFKTSIFESIPKENTGGDCYVKALQYMQANYKKSLRLVHGLVRGQGALEGVVYNHAWVEDKNQIIDMTLPAKLQKSLDKDLYYAVGHIKTTYSYTHKEMTKKMLDVGTYGPWEKKLLSNKY